MEYEEIKKNREQFRVSENLYECPICCNKTSIKGFIQHVKNHFFKRDLTVFHKQAILNGKINHQKSIEKYNKNPNKCLYCGKAIIAQENDKAFEIKHKKFCNSSCFAKYNNQHRDKSVYLKVKETWKKRNGKKDVCRICGKLFKKLSYKQVFCSKQCREKSYGTKDELIQWIYNFVNNNGYIPTSKMNWRYCRLAKKYFGSWNNAIKALGYEPYTQKYGKRNYKCKDGHIADSISEMIVDNWLFEHKIQHERRKKYPQSKKDCDFFLKDYDIWLEYFGLKGEDSEYDKNILVKRETARKKNLKLVEIFPQDLFPHLKLNEKLLFLFK